MSGSSPIPLSGKHHEESQKLDGKEYDDSHFEDGYNNIDKYEQAKQILLSKENELKDILQGFTFKNYKVELGGYLIFDNNLKGKESHISIQPMKYEDENGEINSWYSVNCETKVEISSHSLANPKLNYQNTSARIVKHKKITNNKPADTIDDVIKIIKKHKNTIDKY